MVSARPACRDGSGSNLSTEFARANWFRIDFDAQSNRTYNTNHIDANFHHDFTCWWPRAICMRCRDQQMWPAAGTGASFLVAQATESHPSRAGEQESDKTVGQERRDSLAVQRPYRCRVQHHLPLPHQSQSHRCLPLRRPPRALCPVHLCLPWARAHGECPSWT